MDVAPGHLLSRFDQQDVSHRLMVSQMIILWLSRLNDGHEYMVDYMFDRKKCLVLLYGPVS